MTERTNYMYGDVMNDNEDYLSEGVTETIHTEAPDFSGTVTMTKSYYDDLIERVSWLGALEASLNTDYDLEKVSDIYNRAEEIYEAFNSKEEDTFND